MAKTGYILATAAVLLSTISFIGVEGGSIPQLQQAFAQASNVTQSISQSASQVVNVTGGP
jgi:hypothetical protein